MSARRLIAHATAVGLAVGVGIATATALTLTATANTTNVLVLIAAPVWGVVLAALLAALFALVASIVVDWTAARLEHRAHRRRYVEHASTGRYAMFVPRHATPTTVDVFGALTELEVHVVHDTHEQTYTVTGPGMAEPLVVSFQTLLLDAPGGSTPGEYLADLAEEAGAQTHPLVLERIRLAAEEDERARAFWRELWREYDEKVGAELDRLAREHLAEPVHIEPGTITVQKFGDRIAVPRDVGESPPGLRERIERAQRHMRRDGGS